MVIRGDQDPEDVLLIALLVLEGTLVGVLFDQLGCGLCQLHGHIFRCTGPSTLH